MLTITHPFVSGKADGVDPTLINPSNWNATHVLTVTSSLGFRNRLTNGDFRMNQRAYASAATLAAASYGHDRWKAGASGGDYSFTQLNSDTQITIASGKSLIQVVEAGDVEGGSYVVSWAGTATGRVGTNSATPSGNFAVSPITITGQTPGTVMSVEFTGANAAGGSSVATNAGTLGLAQLEQETAPTVFERIPMSALMARCIRYYRTFSSPQVIGFQRLDNGNDAYGFALNWDTPMRVAPSLTMAGASGAPMQRFVDGPSIAWYGYSISNVVTTVTGCGFGFALGGASAPATSNGLVAMAGSTAWQINLSSEL